jgi:hypothetical protein
VRARTITGSALNKACRWNVVCKPRDQVAMISECSWTFLSLRMAAKVNPMKPYGNRLSSKPSRNASTDVAAHMRAQRATV